MNIILAAGLMVGAVILYDNLPANLKPAMLMFLTVIIAGMVLNNYDKIKAQLQYIFLGKE
jgi:hypothetical protein